MNRRFAVAAEITLVFLLILVQLWFVGEALSFFVLLPLGVMLASWVIRKSPSRPWVSLISNSKGLLAFGSSLAPGSSSF